MSLPAQTRTILLGATAAVLLALLAFLFVKTTGLDVRRDADAGSLLRELRRIDAGLDAEALRYANDLAGRTAAPGADRASVVDRILRELDQGAPASLTKEIPALRAGVAEKQKSLEGLKEAHVKTIAALKAADDAAVELAAEADRSRLRNPRLAPATAGIAAQSEVLRLALRQIPIDAHDAAAREIEPRIAVLRAAAATTDAELNQAAADAEAKTRTFLVARAAEVAAFERVSFQPLGPRIDLVAQNLWAGLTRNLESQERWRTYLFFYAGALLIIVGYLATRVIAAQGALRAANEGLEKRVAERTSELSSTLDKLKESEAALVQTEKMSSLGQLVAGVAHEINTPLAYVKNSVANVRDRMPELRDAVAQSERLMALLQSEAPDQADLNEAFAALSARLAQLRENQVMGDMDSLTKDGLHGIEQISELVMNLKNFSRLDRAHVASFNVNDGVNATLLIARTNLRNVEIVKRLDDNLPHITCSPSQVNQVLLNLVTNAAQAMDKPGATITVTTRPVDAGMIAIEVADNGKGIPPEILPKIFDPFFTTKEVGKGTGLGLSIAYKIAAQHGGFIDVQSEVGQGTRFTLNLPLQPPAQEAKAA